MSSRLLIYLLTYSLLTAQFLVGCAAKKSALLLERHAHGLLADELVVGQPIFWRLQPSTQTQSKSDLEISVSFASAEFLRNLFANKAIFGVYAGPSPYLPEHLVFYVTVKNRGTKKVFFQPSGCILIDDRGNQYQAISTDYVTATAESHHPVGVTTQEVVEGARPGYFGVSLPVGQLLAPKSQRSFALLQGSSVQPGYLFPGVTHDGLIAFWSPAKIAKSVHLLITDVRTDFDANDQAKSVLDFTFDFSITGQ